MFYLSLIEMQPVAGNLDGDIHRPGVAGLDPQPEDAIVQQERITELLTALHELTGMTRQHFLLRSV